MEFNEYQMAALEALAEELTDALMYVEEAIEKEYTQNNKK